MKSQNFELQSMKKFLLTILFVLSAATFCRADKQGSVPDFAEGSTMTVVGVSPSSWTIISSNTVYSGLSPFNPVAYFVDHAPQNQSDCLIAITTSPVAPGTTFYGYTYRTTDVPWILSIDRKMYIWAISAGAVVQQLLVQAFR